ncbi:MAG: hypothetical protein ABI402_10335 [Ferruginibacter sp.]
MNNIKFTGANIAAALLVLAYFFPWAGAMTLSLSGFSITSNGISPGMLAGAINGLPRFFMILAILVPAGGAIILYQNITGNKKFDQFYKPAHIVPALYLILGIVGLYFKMKPDAPAVDGGMFGQMSRRMSDMTPGAFDILSFGIYLSLAAAVYLLLVSFGKIKDKEYYKSNAETVKNNEKTDL